MTRSEEKEQLARQVGRARTLVEKGDYEAALDKLERAERVAASPVAWTASVPWPAVVAFALDAFAVGMVVGVIGKTDPWGVVHAASAAGLVGGIIGMLGALQSLRARSWLGLIVSGVAVLGILFALIGLSLPPGFHFMDLGP